MADTVQNGIVIRAMVMDDFSQFRQRLSQINLDAFTTNSYAHNFGQLTEQGSIDYFQSMFEDDGGGLLAFDSGQLAFPEYPIAFLFGIPLRCDSLLHQTAIPAVFEVSRCRYVAAIAVDRGHRGRGVGKLLIREYFDSLNQSKTDAVLVRTNEADPGLLAFYEASGFERLDITAIQDGFIQKRYFCCRLDNLDATP